MTSSHTMSSFKSRRLDSVAKSSSLHSVTAARVKSSSAVSGHDQNESNEEVRHRVSYIREQKLAAINYATITFKSHKNESTQSIIKYVAAKDLEITSVMLRKWLKSTSKIEFMTKETRKNRVNNVCQESKMKTLLLTQFNKVRKFDRKIIKRWFTRHAKKIYEKLYSHRVIKRAEKSAEYNEFRFSHDWFMNFKKRSYLNVRCRTKVSQMIRILMIYEFMLIITSFRSLKIFDLVSSVDCNSIVAIFNLFRVKFHCTMREDIDYATSKTWIKHRLRTSFYKIKRMTSKMLKLSELKLIAANEIMKKLHWCCTFQLMILFVASLLSFSKTRMRSKTTRSRRRWSNTIRK
jgi:ribosomal protein S20